MRSCLALIILLALMLPRIAFGEPLQQASAQPAQAQSALAITDPRLIRGLAARFPLQRMLDAGASQSASSTDVLFTLPALIKIRGVLNADFERFIAARKSADSPTDDVGVGETHAVRLFDRELLNSSSTQFVLVGIANRMDRAYVAPVHCGEIRLIYRLQRADAAPGTPRLLPMTLNLVLNALIASDAPATCADRARPWLTLQESDANVASETAIDAIAATLTSEHVDRIEINLQIAHTPRSATHGFRTDYLQKVFRRGGASGAFEEAVLENQIDRNRLLADQALAQEFRAWLLAPDHLAQFDAGTVLIPERFLATASVVATPAGLADSRMHPARGLMQSDNAADRADEHAVFTDGDVVAALARASAKGFSLRNIRSPQGFARRLNDTSCGGCHQVRGIGGFHFPGTDIATEAPVASGVAASPHFLGEQPRRRDIVRAMHEGRAPDFSRGFSDRPQLRGDMALAGSGVADGWGAHCYRAPQSPGKADASFAGWTCASGLTCQPVDDDASTRFGMCFVGGK